MTNHVKKYSIISIVTFLLAVIIAYLSQTSLFDTAVPERILAVSVILLALFSALSINVATKQGENMPRALKGFIAFFDVLLVLFGLFLFSITFSSGEMFF
jgi:hypothetical protein